MLLAFLLRPGWLGTRTFLTPTCDRHTPSLAIAAEIWRNDIPPHRSSMIRRTAACWIGTSTRLPRSLHGIGAEGRVGPRLWCPAGSDAETDETVDGYLLRGIGMTLTAYQSSSRQLIGFCILLSRQSRNQTGGRRQDSSSAVRAILDDPPIHIRPVCSRKRGCEGHEPCGFNAFQHAHGCTPPRFRPQDSSHVLSRVSS
jgi:hypothetical protein